MRHALPILAALALAACQPQAPDGKPASAPADAPPVVDAASAAAAGVLPDAFKGCASKESERPREKVAP